MSETAYRGLAAAIILAALRDSCCQRNSCPKARPTQPHHQIICINCRRDAESFIYSDWCKHLLDLLNIDRSALYRAIDADTIAPIFNHRGRPALTNCTAQSKMQSDLQVDGT